MSEGADVAARICALEQRLLVAVLRDDHRTRLRTRSEIARLKGWLADGGAHGGGTERPPVDALQSGPPR